ncbi:hypothetical protein [Salinibacter ruber]|uniref:hypothetical protein n=1 Tax=Salinibacter ruber TaxID=146919 RepID=UPI0013C2E222|nr:hypothetical protein [Salinibacter ruber]
MQESLGRLEDFAAQAQAENTIRAYAADLENFRHWCKNTIGNGCRLPRKRSAFTLGPAPMI